MSQRWTHALIWITARDRSTSAQESIGLWTGAEARTITVGGQQRVYQGVGAILGLEDMVAASDLQVGDWSFEASSLHPGVVTAVRSYDTWLAPVEVHLWDWDPHTGQPLAVPKREWRGTVMNLDLPTPEEGGNAVASLHCVSDEWRLTKGLPLKRSDAALGADRFRQYGDISGNVPVAWGEKMSGQVNTITMPIFGKEMKVTR